jgi:hypothetical protein
MRDVRDKEKILTVYIINKSNIPHSHAEKDGYAVLSFPTTVDKASRALREININGRSQGFYLTVNASSVIPGLADKVPENASINELNYLSEKVAALDSFDRDTFSAAIEAQMHCGSITELINLTENLENFERFPAFDLAQYGNLLLENQMDEYTDMIDKLADSDKPYERAFASYVELLEQNFDVTKYAYKVTEAELGSFTGHGYILEGEGFEEKYRGEQDIPQAYCVTPKAHDKDVGENLPSFLELMKEKYKADLEHEEVVGLSKDKGVSASHSGDLEHSEH